MGINIKSGENQIYREVYIFYYVEIKIIFTPAAFHSKNIVRLKVLGRI